MKDAGQNRFPGPTIYRLKDDLEVEEANGGAPASAVSSVILRVSPTARIHPVCSKQLGGRTILKTGQGRLECLNELFLPDREEIWAAHRGPFCGKSQRKSGSIQHPRTGSVSRGRERFERSLVQKEQFRGLQIRHH